MERIFVAGARAPFLALFMIACMATVAVGAAPAADHGVAPTPPRAPAVSPVDLAVELCEGDGPFVAQRMLDDGLMLTVVASCAGAEAADDEVQPASCLSHAHSFTGYRWRWYPHFYYDPQNAPGSSYTASMIHASYDSWAQRTSFFTVTPPVLTRAMGEPTDLDGANQVAWRPIGGSTLAFAATWSLAGIALESDIAFDQTKPWDDDVYAASGTYSWPTVAKHEIGHSLGLGHTSTSSANRCLVMYPSISSGTPYNHAFGPGDIQGIQGLYGAA